MRSFATPCISTLHIYTLKRSKSLSNGYDDFRNALYTLRYIPQSSQCPNLRSTFRHLQKLLKGLQKPPGNVLIRKRSENSVFLGTRVTVPHHKTERFTAPHGKRRPHAISAPQDKLSLMEFPLFRGEKSIGATCASGDQQVDARCNEPSEDIWHRTRLLGNALKRFIHTSVFFSRSAGPYYGFATNDQRSELRRIFHWMGPFTPILW